MKLITKLVTVFLFWFLVAAALAQAPDWLWLGHAGDYGSNYCGDLCTDPAGNSYVTGAFYGSPEFGATTLTSHGDKDICVFKIGSDGGWRWANSAGGSNEDYGYGVSHDAAGNCYVAGSFRGNATFGNITLIGSNVNYEDIFVAKLSPSGTWLWAVAVVGPAAGDIAYALATDAAGYSYIAGSYYGSVAFGATTLVSNSSADAFAAKLDPSGNWLWARSCGGVNADTARGIALDSAGNCCVAGWFQGTAVFGTTEITSLGEADIFLAKLDTNGNWLWARRAGGAGEDNGWDVSIDGAGNACLTGFFIGNADFGPFQRNSVGMADVFVCRLDANGNWLWANSAGGPNHDFGYSISTRSSGYSYVAGMFYDQMNIGGTALTGLGSAEIYVATIDENGNWVWAKSAGGDQWDIANGVAFGNDGSSRVAGTFSATSHFGGSTYVSIGSDDIFVVKLASDGTPIDDPSAPGFYGRTMLSQPYPNPVLQDKAATVKVSVAERESAELSFFNLRGQTISRQRLSPGAHQISLDCSRLPAGIYFCRLRTPATDQVRKLVLLR